MKIARLRARLRYSFENVLSRGTIAIISLLGAFTVAVITMAAFAIFIAGLDQPNGSGMELSEALWQSFLHAIDAGTVAGDGGWSLRLVMLWVTLSGIFIVSVLIGTITSGLEARLSELRKGRSKVLESNHTLILGWSPKIFSILSELFVANANQIRPRVVILAPKDKVEMEDEIRARFPSTKNTKVICRTGSPLDLNDLEVVSPAEARAVLVLSPEEEYADTEVIKCILALSNRRLMNSSTLNGDQFEERTSPHLVAEIRNAENIEAAMLASDSRATIVLSSELIAKVTAQTCRQSGLSIVYSELLDFDGSEIYFSTQPMLVGKSYKEAILGFKDSSVIGIRRLNGSIELNPLPESIIVEGDVVIVITEDDDTAKFSERPEFPLVDQIANPTSISLDKERTLILGWNERASIIIGELDNYVPLGSEVVVAAEGLTAHQEKEVEALKLRNQLVTFRHGNTSDRRVLESLDVSSFDHLIVLCYQHCDVQQADAKTLITLLHLRKLAERSGRDFSIVSEMLDIKNRELAEVAKADDFIVSDKLVSLMLAQLSENRELKTVFDQLFSSEGSEIYLKPVTHYCTLGSKINFYSLVESASRRNETAIGYRRQVHASDAAHNYGVVVNPVKDSSFVPDAGDCLIVLAEN